MLRGRSVVQDPATKIEEEIEQEIERVAKTVNDGVGNFEVGDSSFEATKRDMKFCGYFFPLEAVVIALVALISMSYGIAFQVRPELSQNGTSTLSFPKRYMTWNSTNSVVRGSAAAENNGDTFDVNLILTASIWLSFALYVVGSLWAFLVYSYRNPSKSASKPTNTRTLWGINHFALYIASSFSDIVRWSILIKVMGYDEYLSYASVYYMIFSIGTTSFLVSLLHQYVVSRPKSMPVNPVFVGFGVFMVLVLVSSTLAFTSQIFIANDAKQTSVTQAKYTQVKNMYIALMIWLVFRIVAILIKMIMALVNISCGQPATVKKVEEMVDDFVKNNLPQFAFKVFVEIFEHLIWIATMIVFDVNYYVYFSRVAW